MKTPPLGRDGGDYLTDDQQMRIAITGAVAGAMPFLKAKLKAYLAAKETQTGRSLAERIGYRLGSLWARSK